jgi:Protein of unknown function (DUF3352)
MRARMKSRLVLLLAAALIAALAVAGCGGSDDSGSAGDPAAVAPASAPLYLEVAVQPEGELKANIEGLVENLTGINDVGGLIVGQIEEAASDSDEPVDFEKEVEPWLGETAGMFFEAYDGDDFESYGIAVQTTDTDATQQFIDNQIVGQDEPVEEGSYEGTDFVVETDDGTTIGVIGDLFVFAEDEATFKAAVDAADGEALSDSEDFTKALDGVPANSFASVYADVGALIEQSGGAIDPDAKQLLDTAGIDPEEMTLTTSLVPGSDQLEVDFASDFGGVEVPTGDASDLLGALPKSSIAAFAAADFGKQLQEGIDSLDKSGIPGEVPPNELKKGLAAAGIDLDKIAGSLQDAGVFVTGANKSSLGGALVLTTKSGEAANTVASIGLFLRAARVPGVTAIKGKTSGFSVRSDELGRQPIVVVANETRIAVAYGAKAAKLALDESEAATLGDSATYKAAAASLEGTPITGFADGPGVLKLVESLIPPEDKLEFAEAKPYLRKARFLAIGSGSSGEGELFTAKLILGFSE